MIRLWRALQQRLRTVCKVGTLCVCCLLLLPGACKSFKIYSSSTCVAERAQGAPALSRCPTFYPWTTQAPMPSEITRAAAAAAAKFSSPSLVCVPRESASLLMWQLLAGLSPNNSCATEFYIPCASGAKADIHVYIVRFAKMEISILRMAQRAELSARLEFEMRACPNRIENRKRKSK